ncbi:MAG: sialate O-acetylesterase [Isosphaeraceae bacterium]
MLSRHVRRLGLLWAGLAAGVVVAGAPAARADVKLPAIFGDHMVLQRNLKDKIWGKADPGESITVSIAGQTKKTTAGDDGRWSVELNAMPAGGPHTLTIEGKNKVTFEDVLVGEVWICSGQSNMQWAVGQANDGDLEALTAKNPKIRMISVPQVGTQEPKDDFRGKWEVCSPAVAREFSAVGYFFGRILQEALDIPIGLIDDAWGGSACEAWVRRDILEKDEAYKPLMARWKEIEESAGKNGEKFEAEMAKYREAAAKARAEGKPVPRPPANPAGLLTGNARPGNIYNGVLKPTIGYGIKGVIWYQGESNAGRAYQYRDLFPLMIQSWRDEWGIGSFPFYWVQLADFMAEKSEPGESAWAELREAQTMTLDRLPATGQAVIIDIGEGKDIHPRNKQDVAKRLARLALVKDYGFKLPASSPRYKSMEKKGNAIVVKIDAPEGLQTFDVQEPRGFTIAGADKKFHHATAKLVGPGTIEVSSDKVSDPVAVRYAWADNPICNVYSRAGLPLTPFRTDDWAGVTAEAK